ncbi:MAG: protein-disulfide reductase DsbD domain-containing protein [Pseudomonadota bacterium]|nr:protein-disulfide reductase DsbD domain-containing protein [Pseudomonadota bacterium]
MRIPLFLLSIMVLLVSGTSATRAQADWMQADEIVEAQLIAERAATTPGDAFHIGLHQIIPEDWHTYWRNPGDFGLPLELQWDLPAGVEIGEVIWPAPEELPLADGAIMDYGYHDEVVLAMPVTLSPDFQDETLVLNVVADWQVCEEVCVPETRELSLTIDVGAEPWNTEEAFWMIQAALEAEPRAAENLSGTMQRFGDRLVLMLEGDHLDGEWRELTFFPFDGALIAHAVEPAQQWDEAGRLNLTYETSFKTAPQIAFPQTGLLSVERHSGGDLWERDVVEFQITGGDVGIVPATPAEASSPAPAVDANLVTMLVFAFLGGLILNLMPCVFPVLSIKVLKFVEIAHKDAARVRSYGVLFLIGVVASFVVLAGLLVGLREFGLPVAWGFQLQLPIVVAILALLFFVIGLNLLGVFEIGTSVQGLGAGLADGDGAKGAFFTGVLAVVVAAPCVGPLAAGALGLALTQPVLVVLAVAAMMGVGLALPFVVLAFAPALLRYLPKPGGWMVTFKQFLAFPMFASMVWLLWVLSIQAGSLGVLWLGIAVLALTFAIWALQRETMVWKIIGALAMLGMLGSVLTIARLPAATSTSTIAEYERAWSAQAVVDAQLEGRAVFVDVTAAWCVTCQVNKMRVLSGETVQAAFRDAGVVQMKADWTNRDDAITELIYSHGQAGVPLYLFYPAGGGDAQVLPSVLTEQIMFEAIEAATR